MSTASDASYTDRMTDTAGVSEQEWRTWRGFLTMHGQLARALDRQLQRDAGISQAEYGVLVSLSDAPQRRLRTGELAELLAWEKSRVSHQIARMEKRGLVERSDCDEDARGTWIGLTAEGRRVFLRATREHSAEIRRYFLDLLTPEERETIQALSTRVLDELNPAACEIVRRVDPS